MRVGGQPNSPAALRPQKIRHPMVQEAEADAENLAAPGFDPSAVHPVASRYIDSAIPVPSPAFSH
jgi:hypothetical protein